MKMQNKWPLMDEAASAEQPGSTAGGDTASLDVNWDSLDKEYDAMAEATEESGGGSTPSAPDSVAEPVAPAAPAGSPAAPVVEAAPVTTPTPAATPVVPVEPVAPVAPASAQPTVSREQLRAQYGETLAAQYALSEDDARSMMTEPEKVIPRLAARLHMDVVDTVINAVFSRLPDIVHSVQNQSVSNNEAQTEFFNAWPQLKDPKHQNVVWNAVATYRALNPNAKRDEVVRAAGLSAMLHLRLPLPAELMKFDTPSAAPPASFTPAAPSAGTIPVGAASGNSNPFVALSEELLKEDRTG